MHNDRLPPGTTYPDEEEPTPFGLDGDDQHRQLVLGVLNARLRMVTTKRGDIDIYIESDPGCDEAVKVTDNFTAVMTALRGWRAVMTGRRQPKDIYAIRVSAPGEPAVREFVCSLPGAWYEIRRERHAEYLIWHDHVGTKSTDQPKHEPAVESIIAEWRSRQPPPPVLARRQPPPAAPTCRPRRQPPPRGFAVVDRTGPRPRRPLPDGA